jgi:1-acyl-sn-glycerol-3-phosphate acyltransferase
MRTIILFILYVFFTLLLIPLLLLCYVFGTPQPILWGGKNAIRIGPIILGIRIEVAGVDIVKKNESYIFMSNHLSFLDGPLLYYIIPQPIRVILKKEIFRIPVIGLGMKQVGFVPVDRKGVRGGKKSIDHAARLMKDKGYSFLIFPEGTRSRDGKLQEFRRGGFFLALASQTAIVPISLQGTYELMPKGSFFAKRGKVRIIFHSPISVQGKRKEDMPLLMEEVRSVIQSGLAESENQTRR